MRTMRVLGQCHYLQIRIPTFCLQASDLSRTDLSSRALMGRKRQDKRDCRSSVRIRLSFAYVKLYSLVLKDKWQNEAAEREVMDSKSRLIKVVSGEIREESGISKYCSFAQHH
jgi:hypothetical protein